MNKKKIKGIFSVVAGALLVAGTSVGGGMLALPVLTSSAGFVPSLSVYLLCWVFMASTGLLFLEMTEGLHKGANILSMAKRTLGRPGVIATWILYLFLFYSLNIAYIIETGKIVVDASGGNLSNWMGSLCFTLLFAPCIIIPTVVAGRVNSLLMFGLIISYLCFVILGFPYIDFQLLTFSDWSQAPTALPIAFTSFAYQGIIPTLVAYFQYDIKKARKAILIGSFIPFITYSIWQALIMGIIPVDGPHGLSAALQSDLNACQPLNFYISNVYICTVAKYFAFFALVTSFLGVTLGLRDFLADSLKIKKTITGKIGICFLVFTPPLVIAAIYPNIFLVMLEYAGGVGCALLLGLLPVIMVWRSRYHLKLSGTRQLSGGKWVLILLGVFVVFEVIAEMIKLLPAT
jgi:tyrosine-specific transport protein